MAKLTPALLKVLEIVKLDVPVTPTQINDYVGAGNYASKHILYLKNSGYQFNVVRDGRTVVSYTLIGIPDNANDMIAAVGSRKSKTVKKVAKAPKATPKRDKLVEAVKREGREFAKRKQTEADALTKAVERWQDATNDKSTKITAPKKVVNKNKKSVADIKAKNLAKLKAVGERFNKANKPLTDAEILSDVPKATSFSIDDNWDSIDGLDLSKII